MRYDARPASEAPSARLESAGALAHVDAISPIDEPNLDYRDKSASIVAAVAIIRDVFHGLRVRPSSPATARRSQNCLTTSAPTATMAETTCCCRGGVISNFALKLLPHQGLILVPGGPTRATASPRRPRGELRASSHGPSAAA